jgi:two-component system chemotaxis sensor kinase CheA
MEEFVKNENDPQEDLLKDFLAESLENIEHAEQGLLAFEQEGDGSGIHDIFRAVHSIKGAAGFFKLENIEEVAHLAESILGRLRDGVISAEADVINVLLRSVDMLHSMLKSEDFGNGFNTKELLESLECFAMRDTRQTVSVNKDESIFFSVQMVQEALKNHSIYKFLYAVHIGCKEINGNPIVDFQKKMNDALEGIANVVFQVGDFKLLETEQKPVIQFIESVLDDSIFIPMLQLPEKSVIVIDKMMKTLLAQVDMSPGKQIPTGAGKQTVQPLVESSSKETTQQSIRISVSVLDELLELIGEVVLGRNQFLNKYQSEKYFKSLSQSITKLHQHVIQTRMQPIGALFNKYKRTVRDLSAQLEKKIELHIEGEEIELDRTIIEALSDPLTHLVRNSIDHGIEGLVERTSANKSIFGNIHLRAYHESGQILIEVEDDGKGLDNELIKKKAIEKGLITETEAQELSERDITNLIFLPGFSTKDQATAISGRGVGMDVVKTNLQKIGCVIEVNSQKGKGTQFSARIPLTQAIVNSSVISGLIIKIGKYTLAIPQLAVNEIIKLSPTEQFERIDRVNGQEVFKLRDRIIPLVHLEDVLEIERTYIDKNNGTWGIDRRMSLVPEVAQGEDPETVLSIINRRKSNVIFIVLHFKQNFFGILVDQIAGTEEIVVKRPPKLVKHRRVFAGATILGNGEVSFILDINGMVEKSGLNFGKKQASNYSNFTRSRKEIQEKQKFVVFTYAPDEYFAVPVNLLSEVDRFNKSEIRNVGTREFIQRHGESIPLLRLEKYLDISPISDTRESLTVIIPSRVQYPTGIVAGNIIANIDLSEDINTKEASEHGVMGTFFLEDKLITIIDIFTLLQKSDPVKYKAEVDDGIEKCRVLLAEDQLFFRQLVAQYFKSYGIRSITTAKNGEEALRMLLSAPDKFDLVVSDIEMPVMDGFELISNIRSDPRLNSLPVMALTTLSSEENIRKGLEIGFNAYEIKLDKEKVITRVNELYHSRKKQL